MSKEIEKKQDELRRLNEQVEYISISLNPLRAEKDALIAQVEQLKGELVSITESIPSKQEELDKLNASILDTRATYNAEIDAFRSNLKKEQAELIATETKVLKELKQETKDIIEDNKYLIKEANKIKAENDTLLAEMIDLNKELKELQDEKKSLEGEIQNKTNLLNQELSSLNDKIFALKEQHQRDKAFFSEEKVKLDFEIENLTKTIARLRTEKDEVSNFDPTIKERALAEVAELEKTKLFLNTQIKDLESKNETLTQERVALSKTKESLQNAQLYIKTSYEKAGLHYTEITI